MDFGENDRLKGLTPTLRALVVGFGGGNGQWGGDECFWLSVGVFFVKLADHES
jgi:hypothetical protein